MRRIAFDEKTINEIREFASSHTIKEVCNRFTISYDVLLRISKQHDIHLVRVKNVPKSEIDPSIADEIMNLFESTSMTLRDIADQYHMRYTRLIEFLNEKYSQEEFDKRKSRLYRESKSGDKNPMSGKCADQHPRYVGVTEDGKGYLMCLKPDWYTGRKGSKHIFVHSLVMCQHLGITEIPKGYVVHHIDGNKHNNDIDNLALLTVSGHSKLHNIMGRSRKVQRLGGNTVGSNPETPDND